MITVSPTTDAEYIRRVMLDPAVLPGMIDDQSPDPSTVSVQDVIDIIDGLFLKVEKDGVGAGWFYLNHYGDGIYEIHTALLPGCRGRNGITAIRAAYQWAFDNLPCHTITSFIFSDSLHSLRFAIWSGMHQTAKMPSPATRSGKPVDLIRVSITKHSFTSTPS